VGRTAFEDVQKKPAFLASKSEASKSGVKGMLGEELFSTFVKKGDMAALKLR
jgi:hypothetical protein